MRCRPPPRKRKNPKRDLKIGIIGSMVLCTLLYMVVAAAALGGSRYQDLAKSAEPLAMVLRSLNHPVAATLIASAAVIALPTVIMAFMYGQSRIFFVMARDGLLPQRLSAVNPRSGTPVLMTFITGVIVALIAAFVPLQNIASVANAGTLIAFIAVAVCMMVTRTTHPQHPRMFGPVATWIIGIVAIVGCMYLFSSLQTPDDVLRADLERRRPGDLSAVGAPPQPAGAARRGRVRAGDLAACAPRRRRRAAPSLLHRPTAQLAANAQRAYRRRSRRPSRCHDFSITGSNVRVIPASC